MYMSALITTAYIHTPYHTHPYLKWLQNLLGPTSLVTLHPPDLNAISIHVLHLLFLLVSGSQKYHHRVPNVFINCGSISLQSLPSQKNTRSNTSSNPLAAYLEVEAVFYVTKKTVTLRVLISVSTFPANSASWIWGGIHFAN